MESSMDAVSVLLVTTLWLSESFVLDDKKKEGYVKTIEGILA